MNRLGVQAITGKPYHPTTQGKNERLHSTLLRYLNKQPLAATLDELQAQVDAFDHIYNTQRPHQGLPGRITPQQAWDTTPVAEPPRPSPDRPRQARPARASSSDSGRSIPIPPDTRVLRLRADGSIRLRGVTYMVDGRRSNQDVLILEDDHTIIIANLAGTILIEHHRPAPGIKYVGNGKPRGRPPRTPATSPMS